MPPLRNIGTALNSGTLTSYGIGLLSVHAAQHIYCATHCCSYRKERRTHCCLLLRVISRVCAGVVCACRRPIDFRRQSTPPCGVLQAKWPGSHRRKVITELLFISAVLQSKPNFLFLSYKHISAKPNFSLYFSHKHISYINVFTSLQTRISNF